MSLRAAILSSLAIEPCTGYALSKEHITSCVGGLWQVPQQQIYRELKNMEKEGLILSSTIDSPRFKAKKQYEMTTAGRRELLQWLTEPVEPAPTRNAFLVKLFAAFEMPPALLLKEVERHRQAHAQRVIELDDIETTCLNAEEEAKSPVPFHYFHLLIDFQRGEAQHWINWCDKAILEIGKHL